MNFNNIINKIKLINPNIKFIGSFDVNNLKTGYWEIYYTNGNLYSKGNYINGLRDGYWEEYWIYGNLYSKGNYKNGLKDGYWEDYYCSSGRIWTKGNYINGVFYE